MLNWVDFAIIGVVGLSVIISLIRGFTKEALSLVAWILAIWVGITFANAARLQQFLSGYIEVPSIRLLAGFVLLFIATLFLASMINYLIGQVIVKTGLSGTDRLLGIFFGVARGVVVVLMLVMVGGMTPLPADPWWNQSQLLPHFEHLSLLVRDLLPNDIAANIRY
ncbi:MAG: CvpA family protein [Gammaproteobacteria bacterium]|nr:CvpA family protein [Gammaproteobacteria bacterium]